MPVLYRASFGYLLRHPWQLGLALLGISIGVAVMVAIDLANDSSRKAFRMSMDTINGDATHQIVAGPGGLDESVYVNLRVNHGIRDIAPIVSGYLRIGDTMLQVIGVDLFAEREFRTYTPTTGVARNIVEPGATAGSGDSRMAITKLLTDPGAFLMSAATAKMLDLEINQTITIEVNGRQQAASLAGTIGDGNGDNGLQNLVVVDIAVMQTWMGMSGKLTRIDVKAFDDETLLKIQHQLPPDVSLLAAAGRTQTTAAMSDAFTTNLSAMSLLALLVGIFLIYNSVSFAVLQRRGLIGVLRALGVSRGQIFGVIMSEALVLGIAGALTGVFLGVLLGEQLVVLVSRTISDHFFVVNVTDVSISMATLTKGVVVGIGATVLAAAIPAIEASSYQPRLALLRSVIESRTGNSIPRLAYAGIAMIVLAALILRFSGANLVAGLVAVFAVILGYAFCIPVGVRICSALLTPLAQRIGGASARMAAGSVSSSLSRTGVAIVALAIAVSATIGVSVMVNSFRLSVGVWLDNSLQSDVYVGVPRGILDADLLTDLLEIEGIVSHSTSRRVWLEDAEGRTRLIAIQMPAGSHVGVNVREVDVEAVWRQFDDENAVLVSDAFAYKNNVVSGNTIELRTQTGPQPFLIAAVYQSYDANDGAVMMSRVTYDRFFDDPGIDSIGIYLVDEADADVVMERLRETSAGRQALIVNSNARIRELSLRIFDRTFVITDVLYWLAVGVAIVGILGAMLALQLERAREFGILRAIGMTPWQIGKLITGQSAFIGFLSGIAAIPLGIIMAVLLVEVINRRAFGWQMDIYITLTGLLAALLLAVGAAIVAGIYPAIRAAKSRPAFAMREE